MRKLIGLAAKARSGKDTVAGMIAASADVVCYALADPVKVGCQVLFGLTDDETWDDKIKETKIDLWDKSPREFFQLIGTEWMRHRDPDHWLIRAERAMESRDSLSVGYPTPDLTDPKAPFKLASQAFFGLSPIQTWDPAHLRTVDRLWNMSPQGIFDLVEGLAYKSFPDFQTRRSARAVSTPTREVPQIDTRSIVVIKDIRYENEAEFIRNHGGKIWHLFRDHATKVNAHSSEIGINKRPEDLIIINNGTLDQLSNSVSALYKSTL
jgi:hypothetical protein